MALKYEYLKMKLPKKSDYAYPFKKSDIDNALVEAGVTTLGNLCFSTGKRTDYTEGHPVIVALFPGESRKGYWSRNSPILDIYTVPKEHLEHIRLLMTTKDILNKIMRWLVSLETASNVTRDTTRIRCVMFVDDELRVLDEEKKEVRLL
ncbi:MAG: hypothetical protein AB7D39_04375 [Pseudodesulfovibrio sp.]|uniref:hypothetical protein n=1 Tax=Pseudodesulfovibrio sp. TaxID=2035812 RepID=UPI003D14AC7B